MRDASHLPCCRSLDVLSPSSLLVGHRLGVARYVFAGYQMCRVLGSSVCRHVGLRTTTTDTTFGESSPRTFDICNQATLLPWNFDQPLAFISTPESGSSPFTCYMTSQTFMLQIWLRSVSQMLVTYTSTLQQRSTKSRSPIIYASRGPADLSSDM